MKGFDKICLAALALFAGMALAAQTYEYPFQNPDLPDEERIDNLLSLMTLEEKIATPSWRRQGCRRTADVRGWFTVRPSLRAMASVRPGTVISCAW